MLKLLPNDYPDPLGVLSRTDSFEKICKNDLLHHTSPS